VESTEADMRLKDGVVPYAVRTELCGWRTREAAPEGGPSKEDRERPPVGEYAPESGVVRGPFQTM
jgi:hypothetical protein